MLENINNLISQYRIQVETLRNNLKQEMLSMFKELFLQTPELKAIKWVQYTPYFNDGDVCTFRVCNSVFTNAEGDDLENVHDYEYTGEKVNVWIYNSGYFDSHDMIHEYPNHLRDRFKMVEKLLTSPDMKDILLASFGDHAEVTVTAETIKVSEYQHD